MGHDDEPWWNVAVTLWPWPWRAWSCCTLPVSGDSGDLVTWVEGKSNSRGWWNQAETWWHIVSSEATIFQESLVVRWYLLKFLKMVMMVKSWCNERTWWILGAMILMTYFMMLTSWWNDCERINIIYDAMTRHDDKLPIVCWTSWTLAMVGILMHSNDVFSMVE